MYKKSGEKVISKEQKKMTINRKEKLRICLHHHEFILHIMRALGKLVKIENYQGGS